MSRKQPEPEKWQQEYQRLEDRAHSFLNRGRIALESLIREEGIPLAVPIQARLKSLESVIGKLLQASGTIKRVRDLQDLIGFRVITLFRRDLELVADCVERSFCVHRRYNTEYRLGEDQFGYSSIHYVVSAPETWGRSVDSAELVGLSAEVQVQTLAQHLWAAASHELQYKSPVAVPSGLRRSVNRAAALLELVDLEFERVLGERDFYRQSVDAVDPEAEINIETVVAALDNLWPEEHKLPKERYDMLLWDLKRHGIEKVGELTSTIARQREAVLKHAQGEARTIARALDREKVKAGALTIRLPAKTIISQGITQEFIDRVRAGVYYGHVALTVTAVQFESGERDPQTEVLY